jgi:hypothetical protein
MADSRPPRACRAQRQLPSVELGRHLRLCGHLVLDSLAAVSGVDTSPGNGQQRNRLRGDDQRRVGALVLCCAAGDHRRQSAVVAENRKVQALK